MQWRKHGIIFDPQGYDLVDGCTDFAKSPQAIVHDDFVRVYFTSQKKTNDGKWLSCPQYVDFSRDFKTILSIAQKPIMEQGALGQFDEHGIFPIHVVQHDSRTLAYTSGWSRRTSVSVDMAIGLAESFDNGQTFERYGAGGPIMTATHNEPCMVCDGFVIHHDNIYNMFYIYGSEWKKYEHSNQPERIYKITRAISQDGVHWDRDGINFIPDKLRDECQALPTVIKHKELFHMYFCYRGAFDFRNNKDNAYRLGYAYSKDLINWTRDDDLGGIRRSKEGWDSQMMCYPNVFKCGNKIYMLYNGNEFGRHGFGLAELTED